MMCEGPFCRKEMEQGNLRPILRSFERDARTYLEKEEKTVKNR